MEDPSWISDGGRLNMEMEMEIIENRCLNVIFDLIYLYHYQLT